MGLRHRVLRNGRTRFGQNRYINQSGRSCTLLYDREQVLPAEPDNEQGEADEHDKRREEAENE